MFNVVFIHDLTLDYKILSSHETLEGAKGARVMSGDLVVNDKGEIIPNTDWLFDWEREDTNSYAHRYIRKGLKVNGNPMG